MTQPVSRSAPKQEVFSYVENRLHSDTHNEEMFSGNYVIHAYKTGKQKGREEQIKDIKEAIRDKNQANQQYTISVINDLVVDMVKNGVLTKGGWLKKEGASKFDALIYVPKEIYLSDKIDDFYIKAHEIEVKANNPNYTLNIRFISDGKNINTSKLDCDGYKLQFEVKIEQSE